MRRDLSRSSFFSVVGADLLHWYPGDVGCGEASDRRLIIRWSASFSVPGPNLEGYFDGSMR